MLYFGYEYLLQLSKNGQGHESDTYMELQLVLVAVCFENYSGWPGPLDLLLQPLIIISAVVTSAAGGIQGWWGSILCKSMLIPQPVVEIVGWRRPLGLWRHPS